MKENFNNVTNTHKAVLGSLNIFKRKQRNLVRFTGGPILRTCEVFESENKLCLAAVVLPTVSIFTTTVTQIILIKLSQRKPFHCEGNIENSCS